MIQMAKQSADPMNAIMLSKWGNRMDITTNTTMTRIRNAILRASTVQDEDSDAGRRCRPVRTSMVEKMGRAFRGSLVSGIMAMKMVKRTDRAWGYPGVPIRLDVISSITPSPNMR